MMGTGGGVGAPEDFAIWQDRDEALTAEQACDITFLRTVFCFTQCGVMANPAIRRMRARRRQTVFWSIEVKRISLKKVQKSLLRKKASERERHSQRQLCIMHKLKLTYSPIWAIHNSSDNL